MPESGQRPRVRIKAGPFAGREGVLVPAHAVDPERVVVEFDTGFRACPRRDAIETIPEARLDPREPEPVETRAPDLTSTLCGVGYWQQQDAMKRSYYVGVGGRGHVIDVFVSAEPQADFRTIKFTTPSSAAEVVAALDRLVAMPPGAHARVTTPDAEALATHAGGTD